MAGLAALLPHVLIAVDPDRACTADGVTMAPVSCVSAGEYLMNGGGDPPGRADLLERAYHLNDPGSTPDHPEMLDSDRVLALVLNVLGDHDRAGALEQGDPGTLRSVRGPDHLRRCGRPPTTRST